MNDEQVVLLGECDRAVEVLVVGDGRRRVVRVAQEHHLGLGEHVSRRRLEVCEEAVLLGHGHPVRLAADHDAAGVVDRVAGARHERVVAGIDERREEVRDTLLAADEREHLGVRIDVDVETALHPRRTRLAVAGGTCVARVLVIRRVLRAAIIASTMWSGVGVSGSPMPSEMTSIPCARLDGLLAVDLGEQVRRQVVDTLGGPHRAVSP